MPADPLAPAPIDTEPRSGPLPTHSSTAPRLAWHHATAADVATYWQSDLDDGLTTRAAEERLRTVGENKLPEEAPDPLWKRLWAQISDFTVLALLGAAAVAMGLGLFAPAHGAGFLERFGDSIAILIIVVLNAAMGLVQEQRAQRALDALRDMTAPT